MGVIPSGQENHSGAEHLNFPGGELNIIFFLKIYIYIYIYIRRGIEEQEGAQRDKYI